MVKKVWGLEHAVLQATFKAAQIDALWSALETAARTVITAAGFGPYYKVPGLSHHTRHGVGLDVHKHPYIVKDNDLPLEPGTCFSIEAMICSYGKFGMRREDHTYIFEQGPR